MGTGENIDYNCSAPAKASLNITNVTLDTDYNMLADNESINFTEVNFAFDSANESVNIHEAPNYDKSGSLDDTSVELPVQRNYFRLKGTLNPEDLLSKGDIIPIDNTIRNNMLLLSNYINSSIKKKPLGKGRNISAKNIRCKEYNVGSKTNPSFLRANSKNSIKTIKHEHTYGYRLNLKK